MADKPSTIIAAVLLGIVGVFGLMTMPLTAGALVEHLGFTNTQAGNVVALEIAGGALASVCAVFWIARVNWRVAAITAVIAVIVGDLLSLTQTEFAVLATLRCLTGFFGMGTCTLGKKCPFQHIKQGYQGHSQNWDSYGYNQQPYHTGQPSNAPPPPQGANYFLQPQKGGKGGKNGKGKGGKGGKGH